ncbi:MAG: histidine kinase [Anaerolineales bacterium]|nr:histidine kinase [Anaerolineales bacterium]
MANWIGRLPLVSRLLLANGAVIVAGAMAGTLLTRKLADQSPLSLALAFALVGVALSLLLNYAVLAYTLRPLSSLTTTVDQVQDGHTSVRARLKADQDPEIARLSLALNTMLDRLAAHTATIEANQEQLRALSIKVISAQEEERRRIARELHDDTSQALASLLIQLERMDSAIPAELDELKQRLASARELTLQTMNGLRLLVADLRPLVLDDLGLVPAIRWYAKNRLEPEGIDVEFEADPDLPRLAPAVEIALFRIAQEAISNIVRHADASLVRLKLGCNHDVSLMVEDDGAGFDDRLVQASPTGEHMGLFGIRERVAALGGRLEVASAAGRGTTLRVLLPAYEGSE